MQATVVYNGSSYHLSLTGETTGTAGAFTVTGSGGVTGFSYSSGASGMTELQAATDASFSLNAFGLSPVEMASRIIQSDEIEAIAKFLQATRDQADRDVRAAGA